MFYLLIVYETGGTLMVHSDDLKKVELMAEQALASNPVMYVQTGALPFGPVFTAKAVEPTMFPAGPEAPPVDIEGKGFQPHFLGD